MLRCSALVPSLAYRHVLFGFNRDEFLCVPCVFVYMLNVCTSCGRPVTIIVFVIMLQSLLMYWQRFGSASVSIFRRFLNAFVLLVSVAFFVRQRGARGVVASVVDGRLVVHL